METNNERQQHKQRAAQEHAMSAHAACVEAALAHDALSALHVAECAACVHGRTAECVDCEMQTLCDASPT